jgi:hypothetical protein
MTAKEPTDEYMGFDEQVELLMKERGISETAAKLQSWLEGPRYRPKKEGKTNE